MRLMVLLLAMVAVGTAAWGAGMESATAAAAMGMAVVGMGTAVAAMGTAVMAMGMAVMAMGTARATRTLRCAVTPPGSSLRSS